jgi:ABC-type multidrug transport system fused ATPase/permease subunit
MYIDQLTVGSLVAFLGSVGSLYSPLRSLAKSSGRFQRAAVGAQRVSDLLKIPSMVVEEKGAQEIRNVRGSLEFQSVRFAYPGGPPVLHDVSFRAEPGETVALVGPNGSGKSTLVQLALRLYDPSNGLVLLDGVDVRRITLSSLRQAVAIVFQDGFLFRGSVRENIQYGSLTANSESVGAAARAAHMERFVGLLSRGYHTSVGPRGTYLSGGQRQRVALARAIIRNAPVLLLDEATASVDSESEALIQDALERFGGRRTILLVSHRFSSIQRADRVVLLEEGRVVEIGTPGELQANSQRFRELFAAQISAQPMFAR